MAAALDASLASSTASAAAAAPRPDLTLPSFASSFRSEYYEKPPPGITQADWIRLARRGTNRADETSGAGDGDDASSLLDEEMPARNGAGGRRDASYEGEDDSLGYGAQGARAASALSSRTAGTNTTGSRHASASTAMTSQPSPSSRTAFDESATADDVSVSTEMDSRRRAPEPRRVDSLMDLSSATTTQTADESSLSNMYGGAGLGGSMAPPQQKKGAGKDRLKAPGGGAMSLREQEKVIDELKKDNFSLKLKLHFYEQRLEKMAPSAVEQALRENIQLKVEFQTLRTELKRYKKLLIEGDKAIQNLTRERDEALQGAKGKARASLGGNASARERELEKRLQEQEEQRDLWERKARELHKENKQMRGGAGAEEVEDLRNRLSDADSESDLLRRQLTDAHDELDELRQEVADMRIELADQVDRSGVSDGRGAGRVRQEVEKLEQDNATLRSQLSAQLTMLSTRNDEKNELQAQVEDLKAELAAVEGELEAERRERQRSRGIGAEGGDREDLEKALDSHRDRASSLALELEDVRAALDAKEREIEELLAELDEREQVHQEELGKVADEWRDEVEDAREREREARQALVEKDADVEELADKVEALVRQVAEKDAELQAEQEETAALTHDLKKLGAQIFQLEEEADEKDKEVEELRRELEAVDKELENKVSVHEQVVSALKEKLSGHKSRLSELTIQHESSTSEAAFLRSKVEDLALAHGKLEEQTRSDAAEKERLQGEADEIMRALRKEEEDREAVEAELSSVRANVQRLQGVLQDREKDVADLQRALNGLEDSSRRMGQDASSDKIALELEIDRVKRDLARAQQDAQLTREELDERMAESREKDVKIANLDAEKKDLSMQLASLRQTHITLSDKHDVAMKTLRETQQELTNARDRLRHVEDQLNTDHRSLTKTENQYRDQLNERNTLLLTVYQAVNKIAGADKRKSPSLAEPPKPFSNFPVFHERLLDRLKSVNQLHMSFERRTKELESKFFDQLQTLKRQQDNRHKQLDRFEASLKTATEAQRQWRQRVQQKTLELENAKAEVASLQSQLGSLRRSPNPNASPNPNSPRLPGSPSSESTLLARLRTAESSVSTLQRRLTATQAQLHDAEQRLGEQRSKYGVAEGKWEARVRELEQRVRNAEEKVKRERQGAKERVGELEAEARRLREDITDAARRAQQLDGVIDSQAKKAPASSA
ncbi:anucleate primary sterigmata protein b [Rhodotorula toruloides]|uniref:BY PROTMAP: gi/472581761/gb/EMS19476.1/ anucleate primary sterigmata protein b [Rhodosporidium toruloides NP11] gi/647402497/emb/CDR48730.1/ RHTO0S20e00122g1_1 [Rhodosporidium toruloides] n=1 Tax=Rhodotorula toruloides TaxID=5286 RepID=A0A0K3CQX1_RHOTO|nr:anucleate primary sterigmata protein b [Rhodotorula toruloides]PRQ70306.1 hypothetical protein AAT19DRAFT_11055 [Rhodotorula toruloides]